MTGYAQLLIFIVIIAGLWLVLMRPARNQQRNVRRLQSELQVGDEVVISAGIFGTVRSLDEQKVRLQIAPDTLITVARQVVVRRVDDVDDGADPDVAAQERTQPASDESPGPIEAPQQREEGRE